MCRHWWLSLRNTPLCEQGAGGELSLLPGAACAGSSEAWLEGGCSGWGVGDRLLPLAEGQPLT